MALPSGVRYFIIRNDVEVPLIPADQLPFYIEGLPQQLTPFQRHREGWQSIGETQQRAFPLSVCAPSDLLSHQPSLRRQYLPPDHDSRQDWVATPQVPEPIRQACPALVTPTEGFGGSLTSEPRAGRSVSMMTERTSATRSEGVQLTPYRLPNPSGIESDPLKKEYCTHWIRTNSCDFIQQGCRYKHEMPDRKKLQRLGFPDTPLWYREKTAINAGASIWLRPCITQNEKDRKLSIEPSASRAFRPSTILGLRHRQSPASRLPLSSAPKSEQVAVEMANLIDFEDASITSMSLPHSISAASISRSASPDVDDAIPQTSELITKTLASSLRQGESVAKTRAEAPVDIALRTRDRVVSDRQELSDMLLITNGSMANVPNDLSDQEVSQLQSSCPIDYQEAIKGRERAIDAVKQGQPAAKSSTIPVPGADSSSSKAIRAQHKPKSRSRKPAKSPAAPSSLNGLASSKHAFGKKPRGLTTPNQHVKRGSAQCEVQRLQCEIVRLQSISHKKEQLDKKAIS